MAKRKKQKLKRERRKSDKNRTPISGHKQVGRKLLPPSQTIVGRMKTTTSWMNDRLPEMLWAALIVAAVGRSYALGQFRRILEFVGKHEKREMFSDLTHTGISKLEKPLRIELIRRIIEPPETSHVLCELRLFDSLPARDEWYSELPPGEPTGILLMDAVGRALWHQSQESTDCRWLRVMAQVLSGRLKIRPEMAETFFHYPEKADQRSVEPVIRATEMSFDVLDKPNLTWPKAFWDHAWANTSCIELARRYDQRIPTVAVTRQRITELSDALEEHWSSTHLTTAIDAKHDAIFGMAFYCIRILDEMMSIGIGTSILGRLGLRTILEVRINLKYLLAEDNVDLWKKWREYGSGQAKLNALRFDDLTDPPEHIDVESLEKIAGEDIWEEFLAVNLGSWSGLDLRKLSERSGLKDAYDKHYSWTSGYTHGMWGPIRESCYQTCGNPLHRLHRYPKRQSLQDTVDDAALLVDEIIQHVDEAYPHFEFRLLPMSDTESSGSHEAP